MDIQYELIIIGSGPAGMSAAVYASRAELKTLIVESSAPGGKMVKTHLVENYPGEKSITGVDLSMKMHEHSLSFGASYAYGNVIEVKQIEGGFEVVTEHGETFTSKVVIAATGTVERKIGLEKEDELVGKGVSYCAVCDGAFYKDREVVVVGGGNSALDESLYLTQFASKVTIIIRRDVFRGEVGTQEKVYNNPKIEIVKKHVPVEIMTENGVFSGLKVENVDTKEQQIISGSCLFPYIGSDPATAYLKNLGVLDDQGYSLVNEKMETAVKGLYTVGDMNSKTLRQIVTATADGAIAAQEAIAFINK